KGGPGITRSDLLVINKIDLAPHVGASLAVMERDAKRMRGTRPFVFSNLRAGEGVDTIARFIEDKAGLGRQDGHKIRLPARSRRLTNLSCPAGGRSRGPVLRLIVARSGPSL